MPAMRQSRQDGPAAIDRLADSLQDSLGLIEGTRTGEDELVLALAEAFGAIITDRMMPGPDGLRIMQALRLPGRAANPA